jgi:hypothetical protein
MADELSAYAAALDNLDQQARAASARHQSALEVAPVVAPRLLGDILQIGPNPTAFPNACVAAYYGLASITAATP